MAMTPLEAMDDFIFLVRTRIKEHREEYNFHVEKANNASGLADAELKVLTELEDARGQLLDLMVLDLENSQ